jgi:acetyltransferase-like isoleucine patch superfamily enzyme
VSDEGLFDHCPWLFAGQASDADRAVQGERRRRLSATGRVRFGEGCFVAGSAAVYPDALELGDRSYIAAHAYVTGDVSIGADSTVNPFATVRGTVRMGDGVRMGAHSSLLGFNHGAEPDLPVHRQPVTSKGITVGDDVWIGSHVVVLDGVTIGDHCVVGAGAVVTKDLPAWTIAAGNPARRIRDRRAVSPGGGTGRLAADLAAFGETARVQAVSLLERCWLDEQGRYVDRPGEAPTVRAQCDAVEIADLLLGQAPPRLPADQPAAILRGWQDPVTGLVPEFGDPAPDPDPAGLPVGGPAVYHVLCVGYALDLLGSEFAHPVRTVQATAADRLLARLEALPWRDRAWHSGSWVDAWATAAYWNQRLEAEPDTPGALEALFGWLYTRVDPWTGMWSSPTRQEGRLQMVNGYYRLTRGSFAQFGQPVPQPERVIDTVLDHSRDQRWFGPDRENACNVLDVAHPLWLCSRQTAHRATEIRAWAVAQIPAALARWQAGQGFGFGPASGGAGPGRHPGLQGTEMWLAIVYLLADIIGVADVLGYRPRGVHRLEPAARARRAEAFLVGAALPSKDCG